MVEFMEAMTAPEGEDKTLEKLVGVYRVLIPRKIAAYTYHLQQHLDHHRRPDHPVAQVGAATTSSRTGGTARCSSSR